MKIYLLYEIDNDGYEEWTNLMHLFLNKKTAEHECEQLIRKNTFPTVSYYVKEMVAI